MITYNQSTLDGKIRIITKKVGDEYIATFIGDKKFGESIGLGSRSVSIKKVIDKSMHKLIEKKTYYLLSCFDIKDFQV